MSVLRCRPQALFDKLLRPAIDIPRVTNVQFVLDEGERERWVRDVIPKVDVPRWLEGRGTSGTLGARRAAQ